MKLNPLLKKKSKRSLDGGGDLTVVSENKEQCENEVQNDSKINKIVNKRNSEKIVNLNSINCDIRSKSVLCISSYAIDPCSTHHMSTRVSTLPGTDLRSVAPSPKRSHHLVDLISTGKHSPDYKEEGEIEDASEVAIEVCDFLPCNETELS